MGRNSDCHDLLDAGHTVLELVRSIEKADALITDGVTPMMGSLRDLDVIRKGAGNADAAVHTAFGFDITRAAEFAEQERQAIETLGEVFAGSGLPIVVTGGVGLMPAGETFNEVARPPIISASARL